MALKYLKKWLRYLIIREIKITLRFHFPQGRMAKIKNSEDIMFSHDVVKNTSIVADIASCYNHSGNQSGCFSVNCT